MDDDFGSALDMCPVCKSTRLTTPKIEFKISPKCYHRICAGCVDRKFVGGKTECPISGCKKQLWKRDWRKQTFEDLRIEKEVDIRKRVWRALDKQESDFVAKRDYDDFLEMREEMVMNLLEGIDIKATTRRLDDIEIAAGIKPRPSEDSAKGPARATAVRHEKDLDLTDLIKGLRKVVAPPPKAVFDPFMGMPKARGYYEIRPNYKTRYDQLRQDPIFDSAGYDFQQYVDESLFRACAGLGVFIEDEMAKKGEIGQYVSKQSVGVTMDDPF